MSREVRRRVFLSVAIPIGSALFVALMLWAFSRVLLAVDKEIAPLVALLFSMNILVGCALAAILRGRRSFVFVVGVMILVVLGAGVAAAFVGEQPVHRAASAGPEAHGEPEPGDQPTADPTEEPTEDPTGEEPSEPATESPGDGASAANPVVVAASLAFDTDEIALPPEEQVTIEFDNQDGGQTHNIAIYTEQGGEPIFQGDFITGPDEIDYTFETPAAGSYYFQCDVHPTMNGTVVVG